MERVTKTHLAKREERLKVVKGGKENSGKEKSGNESGGNESGGNESGRA